MRRFLLAIFASVFAGIAVFAQVEIVPPAATGSGVGDALVANPLTQFTGILPTNTEFNYVDGVTSAIQTQLNAKAALAGPAFTGAVTSVLSPRIGQTDLAGGTTLAVNTEYYDTLSADRTMDALPAGTDGDSIRIIFDVTGATRTVNFHTNSTVYRSQTSGALAAAISFPVSGFHFIILEKTDGKWMLSDSGVDAEIPFGVLNNPTAGALAPVFTANPAFTSVNIGDVSDTTVARSGAGEITVEGNRIFRVGGADVPVADGGTGASTAADAATNLGLGTGDSPQLTAVNIGDATDTTVSRAAAGVVAIEGVAAIGGAEATVASATTTDIGAAASALVSITGTTTITGLGTVAAGTTREGRFTGALTLTHNATSLILPGAENITTAAGDRFRAYSLGAGNWVVASYTKADGTPVVGGGAVDQAANYAWTGTHSITSSSATAFAIGQNGTTNPAFAVNPSTASSVTGLAVSSGSSGNGVTLSATGSAATETLTLRGKGSGSVSLTNGNGTGLVVSTTNLTLSKTATAPGTTGAQTIQKPAGTVNFAAAATSLVVTNSTVTTSSVIIATVGSNDATMLSVQAVAGTGTFTLYANAAATAETKVHYVVIN